jgi:hypothetical protein
VLSGTLVPSDLEELVEVVLAHEAALTPVPDRVTRAHSPPAGRSAIGNRRG